MPLIAPRVMLTTPSLMERSVFRQRYDAGMKRTALEGELEDALDIARRPCGRHLPHTFRQGPVALNPAPTGARLCEDAHRRSEGRVRQADAVSCAASTTSGNVSAMTTATVNSARPISPALAGSTAGRPAHGRQPECWRGFDTNKKFNGSPTHAQLKQYAEETLASGRVVPGYGHAVLRVTDPRFDAFLAFGKKYCAGDPVFETVAKVFEVVPDVLKQIQKIGSGPTWTPGRRVSTLRADRFPYCSAVRRIRERSA
jgi:hypothetical protein